ncbi:MAG: hypothetical protein ACO3P0_10310 [Quisquiliibacterium sp.]
MLAALLHSQTIARLPVHNILLLTATPLALARARVARYLGCQSFDRKDSDTQGGHMKQFLTLEPLHHVSKDGRSIFTPAQATTSLTRLLISRNREISKIEQARSRRLHWEAMQGSQTRVLRDPKRRREE